MANKNKQKLSGSLYLALLSGITALSITIYGFKQTILPFSFDEKWKLISNINLDSYNKKWMTLVKSEFIGNIFLLIFIIFLIILFSSRSKYFVKSLIVFFFLRIIFITLIYYFQTIIKGPLPPTFDEIVRAGASSVIFIGVWIPYFLLSEKVQETFIN